MLMQNLEGQTKSIMVFSKVAYQVIKLMTEIEWANQNARTQ